MTPPAPWCIPCRVAEPALKIDAFAPPAPVEDLLEDTVSDDEPRTPGWLTAVGGLLFMLALVWFVVAQATAQ